MSCRVDATPLLAGACVVSLYAGHGVRGDAVPSTGTHGPSPVYNDLTLPADAGKEYRWGIVTPPASGTLLVYEDCSYAYTPPGGTVDLTVTYTYRLWQDGVDMGTAVETIVIGAGSGPAYTATMAALTSGSTVAGFAATYTAPAAAASYTATMAALTSGSNVAGFAATYYAPGSSLPPETALSCYTVRAVIKGGKRMTEVLTNPGFSAKDPDERVAVAFDFAALCATVTSPTVTSSLHAGTADPDAASVWDGAAGTDGAAVLRWMAGGVDGADYHLKCEVTGSDGGRYVLAGVLPVRAA